MPTCVNGHQLGPGQSFCSTCGVDARPRCEAGHPTKPGNRFCTTCGAPVQADSVPAVRTDTTAASAPPVATGSARLPAGEVPAATAVPAGEAAWPREGGQTAATKRFGSRRSLIVLAVAVVVAAAIGGTAGLFVTQPGSANRQAIGSQGTAGPLPASASSATAAAGWQPEAFPAGPAGADDIDSGWEITKLACLPGGACALADSTGDVAAPATYPTAAAPATVSWDNVNPSPANLSILALTCPSAQFCLALGDSNNVFQYANGKWTVLSNGADDTDTVNTWDAVDCPTADFCALAGDGGDTVTWTSESGWSQPDQIDDNLVGTIGNSLILSCASADFCVAADNYGSDFIYDGTTWTAGPDTGIDVEAISCASADFCVATTDSNASDSAAGGPMIYNGTTWTAAPLSIDADLISCPQPGDCMAADTATGSTFIDQDSTWTQVPPANFSTSGELNYPIADLSCWAPQACMISDGGGELWRYHP